ncbi:DNA-3-methyladenine glycosylase [Pelistega indica]|uniref:DNA-3-methyladenine glycosylase II n=1 Tax=Pelistega indica TaxID=1414851 RepID=V8FZB1_9BURK|nr:MULTISPECIES: DNA-3-methyladenine glycosylase [Pelistega]ETD69201.1 DNA-3-methyladenine glycosylase [Pelistega indica]
MNNSLITISPKPEFWDEAVEYLLAKDRILRKIIPLHQNDWLASKQTAFVSLARALISQQMKPDNAQKLWKALLSLCQGTVTPAIIQTLTIEQLKQVGITKRKSECLLDMSTHFLDKSVNPQAWFRASDEQIVKEITAIRGIGEWTAHMFLIFHLQRPNVLPIDDPRLIQAISQHYFSGEPVSRSEIRELARTWQPWSTVATWYLWCSLQSNQV